ncbi:MAG: hypothetical protein Q9218_006380 [Villophora microphyllina]
MPPLRTTLKSYVCAITRRDFDPHTREGRLTLVEIHRSLDSANKAAKTHPQYEEANADGFPGERTEETNKDGGYDGWSYIREDDRDHFRVQVKKMIFKGGKATETKLGATETSTSTQQVGHRFYKQEGTEEQPVILS